MRRITTMVLVFVSACMFCTSAQALEVVIAGDSYAAGTGAGVPGSQLATCQRSPNAAGKLLADELEATTIKFVACSGAKVDNVLSTGQHGEPAQVQTITQNTDLVTLIISGNDVGFSPILQSVVLGNLTPTSPALLATYAAMDDPLPTALSSLFADIKSRVGPNTKVLVAGYPYVPPKTGWIQPGVCSLFLTYSERDLIIQLQDRLNATISTAVAATGDNRFAYVDPTTPNSPFRAADSNKSLYGLNISGWKGRDACSDSPRTAFNTIHFERNGSFTGSFHPKRAGHAYYKELLKQALSMQ